MIEMWGDWVSFLSGVALVIFGGLAMIAYRPSPGRRGAETLLASAIFIGFMAHVGNTLYWQVFGQPAVHFGILTVADLRAYGDWFDLFFKGGGALAGYLHLRALWSSLDEIERREWTALEMAFYPRRVTCLRAILKRTLR